MLNQSVRASPRGMFVREITHQNTLIPHSSVYNTVMHLCRGPIRDARSLHFTVCRLHNVACRVHTSLVGRRH